MKIPLEGTGCRLEDYIEVYLGETGCEVIDWIELNQYRAQW